MIQHFRFICAEANRFELLDLKFEYSMENTIFENYKPYVCIYYKFLHFEMDQYVLVFGRNVKFDIHTKIVSAEFDLSFFDFLDTVRKERTVASFLVFFLVC